METLHTTQADSSSPPDSAPAIKPLCCSAVLTHHWLVRRRGGERVLEALCELLPDAPIYTLVYDPSGFEHPDRCRSEGARRGGQPRGLGGPEPSAPLGAPPFQGEGAPPFQGWGMDWRPIKTSFLQRIPGARRHYPKLLPLMPLAARRMKLPPVDLVVCSDAAIAKAMTAHPRSKMVCYCHSPMRYVWDLSDTYRDTLPPILRPLWQPLVRRIREADRRAAQRVDQFVANSRHVADRVRRHYGRDSIVVHPPVDLPREPTCGPREDFYLCVGQHVPYKRLDLAVEACRKLNRRLIVIGEGPDAERFGRGRSVRSPCRATDPSPERKRGGPAHVSFLGFQPDDVVRQHYRRARALLFPGEEDFGIVPVEAMGHGCPVIAYGVGGATESIVDGRTGVWFEAQTVDCLVAAIKRAEAMTFDPVAMHEHTQQFSRKRFLHRMREVLLSVLHTQEHPAPVVPNERCD